MELFKKQVEDEFQQKLDILDPDDEFYPALLESIETTKEEKLETIEAFDRKKKRNRQV